MADPFLGATENFFNPLVSSEWTFGIHAYLPFKGRELPQVSRTKARAQVMHTAHSAYSSHTQVMHSTLRFQHASVRSKPQMYCTSIISSIAAGNEPFPPCCPYRRRMREVVTAMRWVLAAKLKELKVVSSKNRSQGTRDA